MLKGLDAIGETLQHAADIDVFEMKQALAKPWLEERMTLIIAGTVRVPPENLDALQAAHEGDAAASRAEDGCLAYSYAEDVAEPGLIRSSRPGATRPRSTRTSRRRTWRRGAASGRVRGFRPPPHRL